MSRNELAMSFVGDDPQKYFMDQIEVNEEDFESLLQQIYPIKKMDVENGVMSEQDTSLMLYAMHMLNCYDKSMPRSKDISGQEDNIEFCSKHNKVRLNFVCTNVECPNKLYCMLCRKDHHKNCSRNSMYINHKTLLNEEFYKDYYNVDSNIIHDKIDKLDEFAEKMKNIFGSHIDNIIKHWKNELKTLSKESLMEYALTKLKLKIKNHKTHRKLLF